MRDLSVSKIALILEFADLLESQPGILKVTNIDGLIIVPEDCIEDFCDDMGVLMRRILKRIAQPHEKN